MTTESELGAIRERIDAIDVELQRLLNARAQCSLEVAEVKARAVAEGTGDTDSPIYYRPEREAQILRAVMDRNAGPLPAEHVARLFREVISSSLALEQPLTAACLGPAGTFAEAATIKHFGHFVQVQPLASVDDIFRAVESRTAQYGVVPVENSTEGMVNRTLDCLAASAVRICGEVELRIHQNLMAHPEADPAEIREIVSHEQSLAQCRQWLDANWPATPRVTAASNADAAQKALEDPHCAAVAGMQAAERYGLRVLADNIEDHPDNTTRFLVVGLQEVGPSGRDKTSILVSMRNRPGALVEVLAPFHESGVSLTRLETRPSREGTWSYVFFIDFDGHAMDPGIGDLLNTVRDVALDVRVLGAYPAAVL